MPASGFTNAKTAMRCSSLSQETAAFTVPTDRWLVRPYRQVVAVNRPLPALAGVIGNMAMPHLRELVPRDAIKYQGLEAMGPDPNESLSTCCAQFMVEKLLYSALGNPSSTMPKFPVTKADASAIVEYIRMKAGS